MAEDKLFGDFVSDLARALGFRECEGCKRRKKKLNDAHARLKSRRCLPCEKVKGVRR